METIDRIAKGNGLDSTDEQTTGEKNEKQNRINSGFKVHNTKI